jgi:hypothetical protein
VHVRVLAAHGTGPSLLPRQSRRAALWNRSESANSVEATVPYECAVEYSSVGLSTPAYRCAIVGLSLVCKLRSGGPFDDPIVTNC